MSQDYSLNLSDTDLIVRAINTTWYLDRQMNRLGHVAQLFGLDSHHAQALCERFRFAPYDGVEGRRQVGIPEEMVLVPRHYEDNISYAAVMMESSSSVIDRNNAPALRALVALMRDKGGS